MNLTENAQPILIAEHLSKLYCDGGHRVFAVKGAFLSVASGEFVCVRGPSGSGKSTILKMLGGIETPSSGEIIFKGTPYSKLGPFGINALRRREIGYVLQELALISYLSAAENVELPLLFAGEPRRECREQALEMLQAVGLGERVNHLPSRMSAGERQRTAIARALLAEPSMLIADEPSSSLDSLGTQQVVEIFLRLCRDGVAVLVATHDDRILSHASRVVSMQDGVLTNLHD